MNKWSIIPVHTNPIIWQQWRQWWVVQETPANSFLLFFCNFTFLVNSNKIWWNPIPAWMQRYRHLYELCNAMQSEYFQESEYTMRILIVFDWQQTDGAKKKKPTEGSGSCQDRCFENKPGNPMSVLQKWRLSDRITFPLGFF